jgi:AraC family transcriptional regulator
MLGGLNESVEYIEARLREHLDAAIDVAALARIALTSEYHYRRMFSALAGMPLSEYIRRRRLTIAGAEVIAGDRPLIEIALDAGYGSGEAFARAFRAFHGLGPDEARRSGAPLQSQPQIAFRLTVEGSIAMEYRIVQKEAFNLVGKRARVPLVHEGMNPSIVAFMKGLPSAVRDRIGTLSDQEPRGALNVSVALGDSREEGTELDYWYAAATTGAPADLDVLEVPAGTWAVFESSGPFPQALQYLWRDVYTQWFPSNPYQSRPGPQLSRSQISEDGVTADAELWIPVERTSA